MSDVSVEVKEKRRLLNKMVAFIVLTLCRIGLSSSGKYVMDSYRARYGEWKEYYVKGKGNANTTA